jgi:hypothetical protein
VIKITRVRREQSLFGEEIRVYSKLGSNSLLVSLGVNDFSEANLKRAIAGKLTREFSFRWAKSLAGEGYDLQEMLREYRPRNVRERWGLEDV